MAKGRFLSASIAIDKQLSMISLEAELLYLMTIPHLDRDGLILGVDSVLAGRVCPRRPELASNIKALVDELVKVGLVVRYDAGGDPVLFFKGFKKHQLGLRYDRENASDFPPPPGYQRTNQGLEKIEVPDNDGIPPDDVRTPPESGRPNDKFNSNSNVNDPPPPQLEDPEPQPQPEEEPASPESSLRTKVFDRLQKEWQTVNLTQHKSHMELVEQYGLEAWKAGFNRTKPGARSNKAYVEKCIISEIENPSNQPSSANGLHRNSKTGYYDFPTHAAYKEAIEKDPSLIGQCTIRGTLK